MAKKSKRKKDSGKAKGAGKGSQSLGVRLTEEKHAMSQAEIEGLTRELLARAGGSMEVWILRDLLVARLGGHDNAPSEVADFLLRAIGDRNMAGFRTEPCGMGTRLCLAESPTSAPTAMSMVAPPVAFALPPAETRRGTLVDAHERVKAKMFEVLQNGCLEENNLKSIVSAQLPDIPSRRVSNAVDFLVDEAETAPSQSLFAIRQGLVCRK